MDKICVDLLNLIQNEFPLESRPYLKISEKLGVSEIKVIELLKDLKKDGYIRRLGGIVMMELPSINLFKINVSFNLKEKNYV